MPSTENTPYRLSNHPALYYEDMLADQLRMRRYKEAIEALVRPGDIVADLGTGLGVLAMMAVRAGAARVYAIDNRANVVQLAAQIIEANHLSECITVLHADAREVQLDVPVDIILNELIGDFGTDENIYECVRAFADRNLKPDGKILPQTLRTLLMPVQYRDEFRGIWRGDYHGLDLSLAMGLPTQAEPVMRILREDPLPLAQPQVLEDIAFSRGMPARAVAYAGDFTVSTEGSLQGFMGYFEAELVPGITLANHPIYPSCHWQTWHWPLYPPLPVQPRQRISTRVSVPANMGALGWRMEWVLE
jgi:enediyne biosynthesis protein CalE3